ncbi:hypothetical protein CFBP3846_00249 [Pseudomonas syringae pv. avii]|uniref:Transposase n=5 Tax=Pseudomonas syringae group TaxID=136849 RepID=A0AAD0GUB6_9PSED|nr:hypothetical protein BKM03_30475 [Pseudomonas avellanae]EGH14459.1 Tn501 transposase [Pseudomonas amygdali pv. morsprunorum str. M302280]KWS55102.1 hypothetical protein AL055_08580 [Pseudomonas amygdali pv. morsprunorum]KWT01250.1 hypothetical protein AL046_05830 [Pseudomonas syringae pv. avii]PHN68120.1 hypothetical protein AO286_00465 [Pseudomonas syringae]RMR17088.1 hypothetical protein ALP89_200085 [Pseudomonas syringae pv. persicae]SPF10204.1 hypothetical protein PSCFBP3800_00132 [Pse
MVFLTYQIHLDYRVRRRLGADKNDKNPAIQQQPQFIANVDVPPGFLVHISPLGWTHILLTGEYLWPNGEKA